VAICNDREVERVKGEGQSEIWTDSFHEGAAHVGLYLVEELVLVVAMLVLEVDDHVHLNEHL